MSTQSQTTQIITQKTSTKNGEWDLQTRTMIICWRIQGLFYGVIANMFQEPLPQSTVQSICKKYEKTGIIEDLPRSGRPAKLDERDIRHIERTIFKDAASQYIHLEQLIDNLNLDVCQRTL